MEITYLKTHAEFQQYNFFRAPEWRWERVLSLVDRPDGIVGRCTKRDDEFIRSARSFHVRWRNGDAEMRQKLMWENPGLYYAYDFNERVTEDADAAMYIQARLLAGQTPEEIAGIMGILPDAINWYAALFFDVIPHLEKRDWITKQVLLPALMRSIVTLPPSAGTTVMPFKDSTVARPFMDGSLKLFAYFGKRHLVDMMLGGMQAGRPLTSPDDLSNWLDQNISDTLRRRSAQAAYMFEINKYNVMELFAVHTRIMEINKSDESREQTRSVQERHIKAMVDDIPWAVGTEGAEVYKNHMGLLGHLDEMSAEARTDEILKIASGQPVPGMSDDFPKQLPPPRREKTSLLTAEAPDLP